MPHSPTPPEGRNPPDEHLPGRRREQDVEELRDRGTAGSRLVRANTTNEPTEIGEVDERQRRPTSEPKAR